MHKLIFQGKNLPLLIEFHQLKKSRLEIREDHARALLCYDLSTKQQKLQLISLIEKLYRTSTEKVARETLALLRTFTHRPINSIRFKKMRSRWGSASIDNNLNFNIDLAKLPLDVQQYIIIHEYSHLFEMNHSKKFWATVAQFDPDYKNHRRHLRLLEKSWHREKTSSATTQND